MKGLNSIQILLGKAFILKFFSLFLLILVIPESLISQVENLPCQTEDVAVEDLERKDFEFPSGSTAIHSEGSMHNFTLPSAADYGPCKIISNITVVINAFGVDLTNLPPDCVPTPLPYYYNIALGCPDFTPASCPTANLLGEPNTPTFTNQNLSYNGDFDFGENLSVDIVPVMNINCTNGQSALTSNSVVLDYEICVTVTISDAPSTIDVVLGPDITVCPNATTSIDAGFFVDADYLWDPNGETTQIITAGQGTYIVTVTDANGCTDTDEIQVNEFPDLVITFDPAAPEVCDNGQISVSVNESYSAYNWSNNLNGQTVLLSTGIYDVTVTDNNNCTAVNTIEVVNIPPPNAGIDNFLNVCNDGTTYNLDALLTTHDPGGTWTDDDASGVDVNANPMAVDFGNVPQGTYDYTYTVMGTGPCPSDQATITVEVFEQNNAGTSDLVQYCENPGFLDFFLLLSNPDIGGVWADLNGSGVDLSDPFAVLMDGVPSGTYNYDYLLTANGPCPDQTETLTIVIIDGADAGFDNEATVCEGTQFDLQSLVNGNNDTGIFADDDGSGALTGSIVNTTGLAGQSFNFSFIVGSPASPCGEDIAILTLNIESSLSAGDDALDSYCIGGDINLYDILINEDAGGTFVDVNSSGGLSGNILTTDNITPGIYSYQYLVGDGITCPVDDAEITITFFEDPSYNFIPTEVTVCIEACEDAEITLSGAPPFDFPIEIYSGTTGNLIVSTNINTNSNSYNFSICNDTSGNTFLNDTLNLVSDSTWYVIIPTLTDENCVINNSATPDTLFINTLTNTFYNLDTFACITDTIDINGVEFFDGNSTYMDTLAGLFCDSIVNINVTFLETDTVAINPTICLGDSILLEGMWFNESIPFAEINIDNPNGCDSLIIIDVSFYPSADSLINLDLCSGDSLVVNSTVYNESNPSGTEILVGQSENGCDSIVDVSLTFTTAIMQNIQATLCQNQFIDVGGTTFNQSNPSGQVTLTGSGCDTIIDVDLSFHQTADTTINDIFCPDFSISVNGTLYDINNPTGNEILANSSQFGCDSIVNLDLSFHTIINGAVNGTFCPDYFTIVNGTTYDINNPTGTEILTNASLFGCDSTVFIDLAFFAPNVNDFTSDICDNGSIDINGTTYNASNTSGTEIFIGGSTTGCDSTVNVQLTIFQTYSNTEDVSICEGDSIFLAGAWQFDAGTYVDNFQSVDLCDSVITTVVTQMSCEFLVSNTTTNNNCANGTLGIISLTLLSDISSSITITWTGENTASMGTINNDGTQNMFDIENLVSDNYTVRIFDSSNMLLWEEIISIIDINQPISGNWTVVESIPCVDGMGTIQFEADGGQSPYTYSWNPSSIGNTSLAENLIAGNYFLTVSDINDCSFETSFSLTDPLPFSASVTIMDLSCDASNDGQISIFDISGGQAPYTFNINNQPTDSTTISGLSIGVYNIDISDANNCLISFTEELIASNNSIFASYTENYTILQGDSVNIESTLEVGNFDFEWINNNQTLSCTDCANPTASPSSSTVYDLIITDESGCTQSISVLVEVEIVEIVDIVPNIFSPNGDNRNDEFRFLSNDPLTVGLEMSIFDRWGNLVFRSQSVGNEITWDGTKNGNELNNGVFVYRLIIQSNDGTSKSLIGDVLLLR